MTTWIVTWNPETWAWDDYDKVVASVRRGKVDERNWTCRSKGVAKGDRIFLLRQGPHGRGIVGAGHALGVPKEDAHGTRRVRVAFNILVPVEKRLDRSVLMTGELAAAQTQWGARFSGMSLPDEVATVLEDVWRAHLERSPSPVAAPAHKAKAEVHEPEVDDDDVDALEGEVRRRLVIHRQRERQQRERKLREARQKHGGCLVCEVPGCGFDFEAKYGELGAGFAEVHHLLPLADREAPSATPLTELAVVCANCHRMIHRGGGCRSLDALIPKSSVGPSGPRPRASL